MVRPDPTPWKSTDPAGDILSLPDAVNILLPPDDKAWATSGVHTSITGTSGSYARFSTKVATAVQGYRLCSAYIGLLNKAYTFQALQTATMGIPGKGERH